jgi:hypothetical protein
LVVKKYVRAERVIVDPKVAALTPATAAFSFMGEEDERDC